MGATVPDVGLTPRLIVNEDVLRANIERTAKAVIADGGRQLRPHFKTSKMLEVAKLQIEHGAIGFTCATIDELDALVKVGITDLFWAHQPVGAQKISATLRLNRQVKLCVAIDSVAVADALSVAAENDGSVVSYRIEIDTGLKRAGVQPDAAVPLARTLAHYAHLRFEGIFTHEGHLYQIRNPDERAAAGTETGETMAKIGEDMLKAGFYDVSVSVGSTPSLASSPFVPGVTETRPGTYVFNDANQECLGVAKYTQCAIRVVACVVSRPRSGAAIIDAGLKAMSSDRSLRGKGFGMVVGLHNVSFDTAYEEHGLLTGSGVDALSVGDLVTIVPNHVCGCVNMWSSALISREGEIVDEWKIVGRH